MYCFVLHCAVHGIYLIETNEMPTTDSECQVPFSDISTYYPLSLSLSLRSGPVPIRYLPQPLHEGRPSAARCLCIHSNCPGGPRSEQHGRSRVPCLLRHSGRVEGAGKHLQCDTAGDRDILQVRGNGMEALARKGEGTVVGLARLIFFLSVHLVE